MKRGHPWLLAWASAACAPLGVLGACGSPRPTDAPSPTPPPPTLAPATAGELAASVASPQAGQRINCQADVIAQVTVTNHAARGVGVTGARKRTRSLFGGCTAGSDFTYRIGPIGLDPGETAVVMDRPLYRGGSGCCTPASGCEGTCGFEQAFTLVTTLGEVAAGTFTYQVEFHNCFTCSAVAAAAGVRGQPPAR